MQESKTKRSSLESQIEVERIPGGAPTDRYMISSNGVDATVIEHIEELLQEIELTEIRSQTPENMDGNFTSVFKKISEIERKLKRFESESAALKKLFLRLN
jgi:hypothetical protein